MVLRDTCCWYFTVTYLRALPRATRKHHTTARSGTRTTLPRRAYLDVPAPDFTVPLLPLPTLLLFYQRMPLPFIVPPSYTLYVYLPHILFFIYVLFMRTPPVPIYRITFIVATALYHHHLHRCVATTTRTSTHTPALCLFAHLLFAPILFPFCPLPFAPLPCTLRGLVPLCPLLFALPPFHFCI